MVRRQAGRPRSASTASACGLATVPMAVTASSAFPGFFPPLELTGADVGASSGEFGRQAYTDGGVFDNLGVRMFAAWNGRSWRRAPCRATTSSTSRRLVEALREASQSGQETPLRRLAPDAGSQRQRPAALAAAAPTATGRGRCRDRGDRHASEPAPATARTLLCVHGSGTTAAPLPVPPRAALRRPEARRPRRGGARSDASRSAVGPWMATISSG